MSKFRLSKLSLYNYKLFEEKDIDFENSNLFVLDGPNGYGKTSIFEAIEYLLTGNIERAEKCPEVSGKLGYETHFLAKDIIKPVKVKGKLVSESDILIIERCIDVTSITGVENNPKNLRKNTYTKIFLNGDSKCIKKDEDAQKVIESILGENITNYYSKFYYISQEDRLSFLMDTDQGRMKQINSLFDINKQIEEYKKYSKFKTKLTTKVNSMKKENRAERKSVEVFKKSIGEKKKDSCEYFNLFEKEIKTPYWNEKIVKIQEKDKLDEILTELSNVVNFTNNLDEFKKSIKNSKYKKIVANTESVKQYLILQNCNENLDSLKNDYSVFNSLKKLPTVKGTEKLDIENLKFQEIKDKLGLEIELSEVTELKDNIAECRKNQSTYDKSLEKLQNARKNLKSSLLQWKNDGGTAIKDFVCPYCGSNLETNKKYETAISKMTKILKNCNDIETKRIQGYVEKLTQIFDVNFKSSIEKFLEDKSYFENEIIDDIMKNWESVLPKYKKIILLFKDTDFLIQNFILPLDKSELWDSIIQTFIQKVNENCIEKLSDEYIKMEEECNFNYVFSKIYDGDLSKVKYISEKAEIDKRKYLEEQYQLQEFAELEKQENKLSIKEKAVCDLQEMEDKVKGVIGIYKEKIEEYQRKVIGKIQIPLYIYSGRILQNYQGGLGIFIKTDKKGEKLDSIRLLSSKQTEHDILYTLSSGQLTGVIIALTLTLNKIYGDEKFPCIMIDDPAQTMDDLNIASLVELLRNEFNEYQLIVSTHEDDFSRYVRYKYEKYNLIAKKLSLNV